jgi:sugar lactone lactonase YvrE
MARDRWFRGFRLSEKGGRKPGGEIPASAFGDTPMRQRGLVLSLALVVFMASLGGSVAIADEPNSEGADQPTFVATEAETQPQAADGLSLTSLNRTEAKEVLEGVFESQLEGAAGAIGELQPERFLAPNVAVVPAPGGGAADGSDSALIASSIPLGTEDASGHMNPINLSLIPIGNHISPANALETVDIPNHLQEGVSFPADGVTLNFGNSDDVTPQTDSATAFFHETSSDTDLALTATPTGIESFTQFRTDAAANQPQTISLDLPVGAELRKSALDGGEVVAEGRKLLDIARPTAIDADGKEVSVHLDITGSTVTMSLEPGADAAYPILLDPLVQSYAWQASTTNSGISTSPELEQWSEEKVTSTPPRFPFTMSNNFEGFPMYTGEPVKHGDAGLNIFGGSSGSSIETVSAGTHAAWIYTVPRYFSDKKQYGQYPESFLSKVVLSRLKFDAFTTAPYSSPYLELGIATPSGGWVSQIPPLSSRTGNGLSDMAYPYTFENASNPEGKIASAGLWTKETVYDESGASLYVGAATVEISEPASSVPKLGTPLGGPSQWVNNIALPIAFTASDSGLGIYAATVSDETGSKSWMTKYGCSGVGGSPCPHTWEAPGHSQPELTYDPTGLPQGVDTLNVVAEDPLGHKSTTGRVKVKVDHTAPEVTLSGSIAEQDALGTRRASYTLKATAADGNLQHPQSGIGSAEVKLDGKKVAMEGKQAEEWAPKCTTENCPLSAEWTLNTTGLAEGKHTVEVTATDAVGLSTTKTLTIETHAATAPTLTLSGSMTEQATLGTSRPRYILKAKTSAMAAGVEAPTLGGPAAYLGEVGEEREKTYNYEPFDVATDSNDNAWVLDDRNQPTVQLQEFNEKGEWLRATGGAGYGKLNGPLAVATDSAGNVWVADSGDNRIVEFNEKGEFVETFGTNVNKSKVEAAGTEAEKNLCTAASGNVCQAATAGSAAGQLKSPEGIALTSGGNIWVTDTGNNRIEKFTPSGGLLNNLSGAGSEPGKLSRPMGITVGPDGSIWVADTGNNRIERWSSTLVFMSAIGSEGWENGKFVSPYGIDVDSTGTVWVGDGTGRVQDFDETGTYLQTFGSAAGKSGLAAGGVTVDNKGSIWVASPAMHRAYHWMIPGFPVYSSSVGSSGSGNGQFKHLAGLASDGNKGHVWALDQELGRLQEFNEKGEWLRNAGTAGSGAGMLSSPSGLSANNLGNVWVADTGNNRIVEFNEKGEFVETFGTNVNKTKVEAAGTEAEKNLCTAASGNVCQVATAGSAAGQLKAPQGIAVTSTGNLWVADTGNNRIEKYNPSGGLLNNISGEGTEPGKLKEPSAIAVAPDGSIWVADTGNNRIQAWNSSLTLIHTVGKEGTGGGEFKSPAAIFADASGNIWVGDQKNNRVEEFGEGGRYRGQFGANGSGKFSLAAPMGIAVDNSGTIWVADPGHSKIQKWTQEVPRSEVTALLWIDGAQKVGLHGACMTSGCTIEPQWTLDSTAFEAKSHIARVKTTDGLGRSTESNVNFAISRDAVKPNLEMSGELFNAPEGWVEQEAYGLNATATDSGYGATSITFKIDGQQVGSASQTCPDGGCKETLSKQISMAAYSGGSHTAEVIATDGAANSIAKRWTINVDPAGKITTAEAEQTLEAADETSASTIMASNSELIDPKERSGGNNPTVVELPGQIESRGVPDVSLVSKSPEDGFTIGLPESSVHVEPTIVSTEVLPAKASEESVAVSTNVRSNVDSVVRPVFNGIMNFESIRSNTAPQTFSWEVALWPGQILKSIDATHLGVFYEDGSMALVIAAEGAHDAVGTAVPTSIAISGGNVVTLTVSHQQGTYVYPVTAGSGWLGGTTTQYVSRPLTEKETEEREAARERAEIEAQQSAEAQQREKEIREFEEGKGPAYEGGVFHKPLLGVNRLGPPEPLEPTETDDTGASVSSAGSSGYRRHYEYDLCAYEIEAGGVTLPGGCTPWHFELWGYFAFNFHYAWWKENSLKTPHPHCEHSTHLANASLEFCDWIGLNHQPYGGGRHISSQGVWELEPGGVPAGTEEPITEYMYGDGYGEGHNTKALCNPLSSC